MASQHICSGSWNHLAAVLAGVEALAHSGGADLGFRQSGQQDEGIPLAAQQRISGKGLFQVDVIPVEDGKADVGQIVLGTANSGVRADLISALDLVKMSLGCKNCRTDKLYLSAAFYDLNFLAANNRNRIRFHIISF